MVVSSIAPTIYVSSHMIYFGTKYIAVNAIGTQLRDPINSGLTRWRMAVSLMDAAAELGRNPVSKHQIQPEYGDEQQADAGRDG